MEMPDATIAWMCFQTETLLMPSSAQMVSPDRMPSASLRALKIFALESISLTFYWTDS
jgi:hypothetical protein